MLIQHQDRLGSEIKPGLGYGSTSAVPSSRVLGVRRFGVSGLGFRDPKPETPKLSYRVQGCKVTHSRGGGVSDKGFMAWPLLD